MMTLSKFTVTEKAMRPASKERKCFYCNQPIGLFHKADCVLVSKMVKVKMVVEYEISVPSLWKKKDVEFNRNDGTWCSSNALDELNELSGKHGGCLCDFITFECVDDKGEAFLKE